MSSKPSKDNIQKNSTKRSKTYKKNREILDQALKESAGKPLTLEKAIDVLLSFARPKYKDGPTAEIHLKLNIEPSKTDQNLKGSASLPNGTGKKVVVAAFVTPENQTQAKESGADIVGSEDLIEKIKTSQKINFDRAVADFETMKKISPIARILGVAGVMPNPKNGTVTNSPGEVIKSLKSGRVDFKNDKTGNIHAIFGKLNKSFSKEALVENAQTIIDTVLKNKPEGVKKQLIKSIHLCSSISPSIPIQVTT